jgi:hypothetical protein
MLALVDRITFEFFEDHFSLQVGILAIGIGGETCKEKVLNDFTFIILFEMAIFPVPLLSSNIFWAIYAPYPL